MLRLVINEGLNVQKFRYEGVPKTSNIGNGQNFKNYKRQGTPHKDSCIIRKNDQKCCNYSLRPNILSNFDARW